MYKRQFLNHAFQAKNTFFVIRKFPDLRFLKEQFRNNLQFYCLLYTSDAADDQINVEVSVVGG